MAERKLSSNGYATRTRKNIIPLTGWNCSFLAGNRKPGPNLKTNPLARLTTVPTHCAVTFSPPPGLRLLSRSLARSLTVYREAALAAPVVVWRVIVAWRCVSRRRHRGCLACALAGSKRSRCGFREQFLTTLCRAPPSRIFVCSVSFELYCCCYSYCCWWWWCGVCLVVYNIFRLELCLWLLLLALPCPACCYFYL